MNEAKSNKSSNKTDDVDTTSNNLSLGGFVSSGHRRLNFEIESSRLTKEINFLRDQLDKIGEFKTPNPITLKAYETMLADRESLLRRLNNNLHTNGGKNGSEQLVDKQAVLDISY